MLPRASFRRVQQVCSKRCFSSKSFVDSLRQKAAVSHATTRVVLPESQDPRVLKCAKILVEEQLATPILLDSSGKLRTADVPAGVEVCSPASDSRLSKYAQSLYEMRKSKGLTQEGAEKLALDPLYFAALMLDNGDATCCVAGSEASTADVLRAAIQVVRPKEGLRTVSTTMLMVFPERVISFADCAAIQNPTSEQLADIAISSALSHKLLIGETPKVSLLSHSTKGSASHDDVSKVKAAGDILRSRSIDFEFEDELQADAAIVPAIGKKKAPSSAVAGSCNVLVFPDLDAGNIAYKLVERLAGAEAIGPLVQGLRKPYMDLSRGCSVDDIVNTACAASILAAEE